MCGERWRGTEAGRRDSLGTPLGTAWDYALRVISHTQHFRPASVYCGSCGEERAARAQHLLGSPRAPDPSATIKGAGPEARRDDPDCISQTEVGPGATRGEPARDKDARAICLCKALSAARDPSVPAPGPARGTGSGAHCRLVYQSRLGLPPASRSPAPRGAAGRAERGGGGG